MATYLTPEVCERCHLFARKRDNPTTANLRITARETEEVRQVVARPQLNRGVPRLLITDGDALGRGGLWLEPRPDRTGLDRAYAGATLPNVTRLWGREAVLETLDGDGAPCTSPASPERAWPAP